VTVGTVLRATVVWVMVTLGAAISAARADADPPGATTGIVAAVDQLAPEYGLDPALVRAVIATESAYDATAVSPKNAIGLMQLLPETAMRFGIANPFDPVQNLHGGMRYLRWLLDYFNGDLSRALAGYNAGEQAVVAYGGIPPYPETRAYVADVLQRYGRPERAMAVGRSHGVLIIRPNADGVPVVQRVRTSLAVAEKGASRCTRATVPSGALLIRCRWNARTAHTALP